MYMSKTNVCAILAELIEIIHEGRLTNKSQLFKGLDGAHINRHGPKLPK